MDPVAIGGWACLILLVLPEALFAKQDRCVDVDLFVIALYLQAEAASWSVRILFIDATQILCDTFLPSLPCSIFYPLAAAPLHTIEFDIAPNW